MRDTKEVRPNATHDSGREAGFTSRRALIALCVGLAVAEEALLQGFGLASGLALAPQLAAPPPYGVFHDLRWLMVYHDGYWMFAGLTVALLCFRTTLVAVLVRLAWPHDLEPPRTRTTVLSALAFVAVSLVFLTPAATALFTAGFTTLWPFYVAGFAVGAPVLATFWYLAFPGWWRRLPPWRPFAWIALTGVVHTGAALAIVESPAWVTLLPAAAAGLFDALAWYAIADAVAHRVEHAQQRHAPVALRWPAIGAAGALLAAAAGFAIAFWLATPELPSPHPPGPGGQPLIDAHGFRSSFDGGGGSPFGPGFVYRRYSYRGLGPDGRPLPYGPRDTYAALDVLARKLAVQVQALHEQTHEQVALLGDSEGTLVEKYYLLTHPHAPVSKLVMTSPIVRPGRVDYPPDASASGWGVATRFALAREASFIGAFTFPISPDTPLLRSLERRAPLLRRGMLCPVPGVEQSAFLPLINAIGEPPRIDGGIPLTALPTIHGSVGSARRDAVWLQLTGRRIPHFTSWRIATRIARGAAAAWQVPSLPLGLGWGDRQPPAACAAQG